MGAVPKGLNERPKGQPCISFKIRQKETVYLVKWKFDPPFTDIKVERTLIHVYAISGLLSGIAGVVLAGRLFSGQPTAGIGIELDASCRFSGFYLPLIKGFHIRRNGHASNRS